MCKSEPTVWDSLYSLSSEPCKLIGSQCSCITGRMCSVLLVELTTWARAFCMRWSFAMFDADVLYSTELASGYWIFPGRRDNDELGIPTVNRWMSPSLTTLKMSLNSGCRQEAVVSGILLKFYCETLCCTIFTALHWMQRSLHDREAVHLSHGCIVTKRTKVLPTFLRHMKGKCI